MPVFAYRALSAAGGSRSGVIDAESARSARQTLRTRGLYATEVQEERETGRPPGRVGAAELAAATRQLATLIEAGVPLADALEATAEQSEQPALARALTLARARVREGESLAAALGQSPRVFPAVYRELVRAGETAGALGPVLTRLAAHTEATAALRGRLRAALAYPAVVSVVTLVVLAFLMTWVVPQVTRLFAESGTPLPLPTRLLVAVGALARATWWLWLTAALGTVAVVRAWSATSAGRARLDAALLAAPLLGPVVRKAAVARLARTLSTLLASGVPLEAALGLAAAAAGNRGVAAAAESAREAVRQGQPLAPALQHSGLFPPLLVRLAATGERSGTLPAALERAAATHEEEVDRAVAAATALLEPLLILLTGALVLALVLGILVPILTLDPVASR